MVLGTLFFIKLAASVSIVLVLSIIAEMVSPQLAGLLAALPTISGITLFFVGLEMGPQFAADSALYTMAGLVGTMSFLYGYYFTSLRLIRLKKSANLLLSLIAGLFAYFVAAYIISGMTLTLLTALSLSLFFILLFTFLFRKIHSVRIEKRVDLTHKVILYRVFFSSAFILLITELARHVGSKWAGILTTVPVTMLPLIVILHMTYDARHAYSFVKKIPLGFVSVLINSTVITFVYPLYGVYYGTIMSLSCVFAYMAAYFYISRIVR